MKPLTLLTGTLAWAAMATASAHTPYLSPSNFAPQAGETVALDAAFAETFFIPEAAFDNSRFVITGPDGASTAPDAMQVFKTRAVAEHRMPQVKGTYRFSTGPRLGALFRTWEVDGKRGSSRDPAVKIPAGAKLLSNFQSLTLAETYVSIGAPDTASLRARGRDWSSCRSIIPTISMWASRSPSSSSTTASRWPTSRLKSPRPSGRRIASRRS